MVSSISVVLWRRQLCWCGPPVDFPAQLSYKLSLRSFLGSTLTSAILQLRLEDCTSLPSIPCLELRPATYCTRLNAQVSLPGILRLEVTHASDLVFPAIPYRAVWEGISCADQAVLASFFDSDWWNRWCGVDSVRFGGDGDVRGFFGECLCFADFVDVARALET